MARKPKSIKGISTFDMGIFPPMVLFSCGYSYKEILAFLKRRKAKEWIYGIEDCEHLFKNNWQACSRTITNRVTGKEMHLYYIFIPEWFTFSDYDMCKLAHEILHICQFAMPKILDMEREHEAVAYTHTHLMSQILDFLRKK